MTACSMARGDGFEILSRHREAADGLQLKATSETEEVLGGTHEKRLLYESVLCFLRMLVHLFSTSLSWTRRAEDQRAFSLEPQGMSQASLCLLSFCFPLRFCRSHLAWWVLTHTLWSSAPGMPSHTFPLKLIWQKPSPVRGSYSFSLCSNTMFSCFSSLQTVKHTLSETCQGSNVSDGFKTFFDLQVLTELYYLQSVVCGRAKRGGSAPPRLASVS